MTAFVVRRLVIAVLILFLVSMLVFLLMRLLPGNPLLVYVGEAALANMTQADIAKLAHQYGLDLPIYVQYFNWLGNLLHGDLGRSIIAQDSITQLIKERIPITLNLSVFAFIFGCTFGILFGVIAALKRGSWPDTIVTVMANVGITIPAFWLGILLIYVFALQFHWLPVSGYTSPFENLGQNIRQLIMPVFVMSIGTVAGLTRQTRSTMLEVIRQDYIRTAWSKGLKERLVVFRHALKNALIPVFTILGMQVGHILGGSIITETIFNIPGMGRLMVNSIFAQDYQVVQAGVIITGTMVLLANLMVDISYGWLDPRIRYR
jgi:peptide/nickel transport system permease protein